MSSNDYGVDGNIVAELRNKILELEAENRELERENAEADRLMTLVDLAFTEKDRMLRISKSVLIGCRRLFQRAADLHGVDPMMTETQKLLDDIDAAIKTGHEEVNR